MKRYFLLAVLLSTTAQSKTERYLEFQKIRIESDVTSSNTHWLKVYGNGSPFRCGHLGPPVNWAYREAVYERRTYECRVAVLAFDLDNPALIVFIDTKYKGFITARYVARLSGQATEFFAEFNDDIKTEDLKLDSLAKALNRMSRDNLTFGQERYTDSDKISLKRISSNYKADPLGKNPRPGIDIPDGNVLGGKRVVFDDTISIDYRVREPHPENYPSVNQLYETISRTLIVLNDGYDLLRANSDQENRTTFHETLMDNRDVIASELKELADKIRTNKFHLVELLHFLNQVSNLVHRIDQILVVERGSDPGFMTIINEE